MIDCDTQSVCVATDRSRVMVSRSGCSTEIVPVSPSQVIYPSFTEPGGVSLSPSGDARGHKKQEIRACVTMAAAKLSGTYNQEWNGMEPQFAVRKLAVTMSAKYYSIGSRQLLIESRSSQLASLLETIKASG